MPFHVSKSELICINEFDWVMVELKFSTDKEFLRCEPFVVVLGVGETSALEELAANEA